MTRTVSSLLLFALVILSACAAPTAQPSITPPAPAPLPETPTLPPTEAVQPPTQQPATSLPPTAFPAASALFAYTGADSNIWTLNPITGEVRPLTTDGAPFQGGADNNEYCCSAWSSDGRLLAFQQTISKAVATGYDIHYNLWVADVAAGQVNIVLADQQVVGVAWQPGTHLLAYGPAISPGYFARRGVVDSSLARGIWGLNIDTSQAMELVKPEQGFALIHPRWSPDGKTLSFEEVIATEGAGNFATYQVEARQYRSWGKAIGGYDWLPDGSGLVYDYLTYAPSGREIIFRANPDGSGEEQLSPTVPNRIAFSPRIAPTGSQLAYFTETMLGQGQSEYEVVIQGMDRGEPRSLGKYEIPGELAWSTDGRRLVFTAGAMEDRRLVLVDLESGEGPRTLDRGSQAAWQPAAQ